MACPDDSRVRHTLDPPGPSAPLVLLEGPNPTTFPAVEPSVGGLLSVSREGVSLPPPWCMSGTLGLRETFSEGCLANTGGCLTSPEPGGDP